MSGETENEVSGWTTDTLHSLVLSIVNAEDRLIQSQLDDMHKMLDERYSTQTKAVDAAFLAQQTAMQTALTAAERAVATALLSAEKAVAKAEVAADKRFEAVNEFRAQLNDQATTFLTRKEAEAQMSGVQALATQGIERNSERIREISAIVQSAVGSSNGSRQNNIMLISVVGAFGLFLSIAISAVALFIR